MNRFLIAVPASFLFLACSVETSAPGPTPSSTSSTEAPAAGAAKPEVAFACSGQIVKKTAPLGLTFDVAPRCIGGGPDVDCGGPGAACAAQDVAFSYAPPATDCDVGQKVFVWNGTACVGQKIVGGEGNLVCKGNDCEKVFKTEEACAAAYASCAK